MREAVQATQKIVAPRSPVAAILSDDPPFKSAHSAVRFALGRDGSPGRPAIARMTDTRLADGMTGIEATAQAGMILATLRPIGPIGLAAMMLRCGPRRIPCYCRRQCCSGRKISLDWLASRDLIAQESKLCLPQNSRLSYELRAAVLDRIYSDHGNTFAKIAKGLTLDEETVSRQHRAIHRWLLGYAAKDGDRVFGIEELAWHEADIRLRARGIVG